MKIKEVFCLSNSKTPLEHIRNYCLSEKKTKIIEKIVYHKYNQDLSDLISSYLKNENKDASAEIIEGFKTTLISNNTLSTNIRLAEEEINDIVENKVRLLEKKYKRNDFFRAIIINILSSFIFTLLIILIAIVAENQIKTWIREFGSNNNVMNIELNKK